MQSSITGVPKARNIKAFGIAAADDIDYNNLPGVIGDTVRWILGNAQKPQPELALLNTLAVLGAVFGRRYTSHFDTRTNLYTVGLAGTAAGKNHSKKSIKGLMIDAGLQEFLGSESIVSGSGLLTSIVKKPAQIMHLDEFGMLLEAIMDKKGASHMKIASKIITELYSASGEKYMGGQYADAKAEPVIIACPNLCIFGISTLEKYTGALNHEAIKSGELNRFIVFKTAQDNPKRRRDFDITPAPRWLIKAWNSFKPSTSNTSIIEPKAILVEWPGLRSRIDDMGDFEDENINLDRNQAGPLWGRYRENVIKIAMIFAICENWTKPVIKSEHLDIAEVLVRKSVNFMVDMVADHMIQSKHDADCKEIFGIITKSKTGISSSELCRRTQRLKMKERNEILQSLIEQEKIIVKQSNNVGVGRKANIYFSNSA